METFADSSYKECDFQTLVYCVYEIALGVTMDPDNEIGWPMNPDYEQDEISFITKANDCFNEGKKINN